MANEFGSDRMWGLEELPLPDPISWWPQTYGWLAFAALALGFLAWLGGHLFHVWKRRGYRRDALARISAMERERSKLVDLSLVLRRTALAAFPRDEVAGLSGEDWTEWMNLGGGEFSSGDADWLERLAYDSEAAGGLSAESAAHLIAASRAFVRSHRARL